MKQGSSLTTINNHHNTTTTAAVCGHCGVEEQNLLHHVRLRGNFRRLCTTCVLRLHPQYFCPSCLAVYDRSPPNDAVVCYKCYSSSHPNCASVTAGGTPSSRLPSPCSSCLNPNALVFNLKRVDLSSTSSRSIDKSAARLLLAATKIASLSMSKAEVAAAMEAERRSKEASYTKKRARESLDHVVYLMEKEKKSIGSNKVVGNANSSVVAMPLAVVDPKNDCRKVDASNEVLVALNAVELKEKARQQPVESVVSEGPINGVVVMDVEVNENEGLRCSSVTEYGNGNTDNSGKMDQGEQVNNGVVPSVSQEKNHAMEGSTDLQP